MSHYFYENAFDWIDNSENFGYSIEQDLSKTSSSGSDVSAHDYIIEVHYLGDAANALYLDVNGIDTSILSQVEYVTKEFSPSLRQDAVQSELVLTNGAFDSGSYTGQQSQMDPGFGAVEIMIPTTTTEADQIAANGTYRPHDYLYMEAGLYFDVIQADAQLVANLNNLISDPAYTIQAFSSSLDSAVSAIPLKAAGNIDDASNDIISADIPVVGMQYYLDQVPGMVHFDNVNYYSYDNFSAAPNQINTSSSSIDTSETSLIGEFRISESTGDAWNINANFVIDLSTINSTFTYLPVLDMQQNDINVNLKNTTGYDINFLDVQTTISRDASGNLSFSEQIDVIDTLGDGWNTVSFDNNYAIGGTNVYAGEKYAVDHYSGSGNSSSISMNKLVDGYPSGYFGISNNQNIYLYDSDSNTYYDDFVNGLNQGTYTVLDANFQYDALVDGVINGATVNSGSLYHKDVNDSISSIPSGNYLVDINSQGISLTSINGGDADYDGISELETNSYQLYENYNDGYYSVTDFEYYINNANHSVISPQNWVKGTDYETSETVVPKMNELDTTWNTADISGGGYMDINNMSVMSGIYKVTLNSDTGNIILLKTFINSDNVADVDNTFPPVELNPSSTAMLTSNINANTQAVTQVDYKQYFYDLINTDTVDGAEIIPAAGDYTVLLGGTKYVDGATFDNTGINFINTADVSSITSIDAGDETDFIAGGVGGLTIDGGSGIDMYFSTPASINIVEDQDGNIISERGVTVDLTANRVIYLKDGSEDIVSNIEYFMGSLGDDLFVGSALHSTNINSNYTTAIQAFNPTAGKDEIFGAKDTYDLNGNLIEVMTAVDYDSMQGGQGVIFILDGSDAATHAAVGSDELSFTKISEFAGDYWDATSWAGDGWLPSNDDILNSSGNFSTQSRYEANADGATLILDTFGDTDLAFDIDHYMGSSEADIFFGSNGNDSFDAGPGAGNFMSGGAGIDQLVVLDYNDLKSDGSSGTIEEDENLNLNSMEIDRVTDTNLQNVVVGTQGASSELVSAASQTQSGDTLYRIDFADVQDLSTFYTENISSSLYNVSSSYELYLSSSVADIGANINGYAGIQYVTAHNKIDVNGTDLSILHSLNSHGQLILQETSVSVGEYIVKGTDNSGSEYSTVIKDVEQVVLTDDDVNYFGTGNINGSQEDIYQLIQGGQGDLGEMLYVTTGETIDNATGAANYSGGLNFNNSEVFYSGHHTDFDRNSSRDGWAATVGSVFTSSEAKVWNDEVAQFFVWYDANATDNIDGYEIAVKYQNGDVNAWGIDNRQFDTFQNVTVDQAMANAIKDQFGDSVSVELGEYRVLYEAAYTDIETIVNSNADVTDWGFDFQPTSSRSTFYIQVGGDETGINGSAGISDTLVTNVKVERVVDGNGFKWNINPQAEILVNLPILSGDANDNVMISGDSAETIEAGKGSDVMMGQGGSDNYKISAGDTRDANGDEVVGSFGVAGDVINEIGGSSDDKSDAITLSSAKSIDELSFSRTQIASEYWDNTLKIDVTYDSGAEDTLYVFDHYNQDLSSRAVEQLFLDDGWDSSEIWNLIVGDVNLATGVDEYTGTAGQDILIAGTTKSSLYGGDGQDILIGDQRGQETIFELGNRDSAWDQVADIIEGFGTSDELDLSNLGIERASQLTFVNNDLFDAADGNKIAEFRNFSDDLSLEQLLTEDGAITYSGAA